VSALIRSYSVQGSFDLMQIEIEVDHSKLTPELATSINDFYSGKEDRLRADEGDVVLAVIRLASGLLMRNLLADADTDSAQRALDTCEGWPPNRGHGISLVSFEDFPKVDDFDLDITLLEEEATS